MNFVNGTTHVVFNRGENPKAFFGVFIAHVDPDCLNDRPRRFYLRGMAIRPKSLRRIELCEAVIDGKAHAVDRERGIISRVKVLGKESPNRHGRKDCEGTEYSDAALTTAAKLYEGRKSYIDHPANRNAKAERSFRDLAGTFKNCTAEADGVYADFHFPPKSANGQMVADWAEHDPTAFGLSHNALGTGRMKGKKQIIESIDSVRSVDVVCDPATTRGLYESRENAMAGKTILQILEELEIPARSAKWLLEMDGFDGGDAPAAIAAPAVTDPADEDAGTHLARAVTAFMSDDTIDAAKKKKKINQILAILDDSTETAVTPDPEAAAGDDGVEGTDDDKPKKEDKMESKETLAAKLEKLQKKDDVRTLCESKEFNFHPTPIQFTALLALAETDRKIFITEAKAASKAAPTSAKGLRSVSSASLLESKNGATTTPAKDTKEFVSRIYG